MTAGMDRLARTATQLIARQGLAVTLVRSSGGEYDPASGRFETAASEMQEVLAVLDGWSVHDRPGAVVGRSEKRLLVSPRGLNGKALMAPRVEDRVVVGGVHHVITGVETVAPAGAPVIYSLQIRS